MCLLHFRREWRLGRWLPTDFNFGRCADVANGECAREFRGRHVTVELNRLIPRRVTRVPAEPLGVHEKRRFKFEPRRLCLARQGRARRAGHLCVEGRLQPRARCRRRGGFEHHDVVVGRKTFLVPLGCDAHRYGRRKSGRALCSGHLGVVRSETRRVTRTQTRQFPFAEHGWVPLVRLMTDLQVREYIGRAHTLVEAQRNGDRPVEATGLAHPVCRQQSHRRGRELEPERRRESFAGCACGTRVHRDRVRCCIWKRRSRVGRKEQDGCARPSELPGDTWRDRHPRNLRVGRRTAERDHRLGKDEPDFVGVRSLIHLTPRAGLKDSEGGVLCGTGEGGCKQQEGDQTKTTHPSIISPCARVTGPEFPSAPAPRCAPRGCLHAGGVGRWQLRPSAV